ncbi:VirB3 family type IV secretion system protein [Ruegeria sp. 1NDH52C]|uniref:VirB3 family type IV secretion system protein n=1 Tax=Ruegeria alba TaxID=2916756 RepID=A0ABS9P2Z6_9RHOB|nr:VirB3 family type IV secretion system protein [Ruegeria alba]MCG6560155.1 VirB3 family type IV secretion system protein [Ruegeria alba]
MADQSRVFIGLIRPPKLMGLPIMYAMVWLFGSTLLFLWVQSWVVAVFAGWPGRRSGRPQTGIRTSSMSW